MQTKRFNRFRCTCWRYSEVPVLISRMNRVIDRSQFLNGIVDNDTARSYLKADIPRLKLRAALLNKSVFYSTV
jgi:hypothetical protein